MAYFDVRGDLTGRRFGRLIVQRQAENIGESRAWFCLCDCGGEKVIRTHSLVVGDTQSCGCLHREVTRRVNLTHGGSSSRLYVVWQRMHDRCSNPKDKRYERYGGRGIAVCERWHDFANFREDMGAPPPRMTLDRKNNDLGYSPENCRWATYKQQNRNRCDTIRLTINGKTLALNDWADRSGVKPETIRQRLKSGWTDADAVFRLVAKRADDHGAIAEMANQIIRDAALLCGTSLSEIRSRSRKPGADAARREIVVRLSKECNLSTGQIGKRINRPAYQAAYYLRLYGDKAA